MTKTLIQAFFLMFLSTFVIIISDTGSKLLSDDGFSQFWVAWARFAIAAIILLPFSGLKIPELRGLLDWRVVLRAGLIVTTTCAVLTAIKTEPMANAFGGFFISPIVSYFLSWLFLRERISWPRSILLGISFIGVLTVVRPGFGMTTGMTLAVLAGFTHGAYLMTTRWLVGTFRPRFLLMSQLIIGGIILLPFAASDNPAMTMDRTWFLALAAFGSAFGNLIMVLTNRTTPASVVAPLVYLQLVSATFMGFMVFGQIPDVLTMIGLTIIVCAGLSSLWFAGRGR